MKRLYGVCMILILAGVLVGCTTEYPATNTVYVHKNGTLTEAIVESFDKDYYDEQGLKDFITEEIAQYESDYESGSVKEADFVVEEGIAKLMLKYDGYQSYKDFNGREMFTGTVVQAIAAGYDFSSDFVEVVDGEAVGLTAVSSTETEQVSVTQTVSSADVTSVDDAKVVILNEDTDVQVKGTILYVSGSSVSLKDKRTASVVKKNDGLSYIVYK